MTTFMRSTLKPLIKKTMPGTFALARKRWRNFVERKADRRLAWITQQLVDQHGQTVMDGPFAGMQYVSCAVGSALVPKLIGSYETELHPVVARLLTRDYTDVIDVGCAEGYYAIGMALRLPKARIYAFDIDPEARRLCAALAQRNGVADRVTIGEFCDADALNRLNVQRPLLICDCEGYELELLEPSRVPRLREWDILVELHDCFNPELSPALLPRFAASHEIVVWDSVERDPAGYPALASFKRNDQILALSEFRWGVQQWAFLETRTVFAVVQDRAGFGDNVAVDPLPG